MKKSISRSIEPCIQEYITQKIVLLSGPRQVGKTYISKRLTKDYQYFNFDLSEHQKILQEKSWRKEEGLVIFDEIQKMKKWKQWIKGIWDTQKIHSQFLLTGSSRLDTYKKTGDSLAGRNFSVRLNPFSLKELGVGPKVNVIKDMMSLGSFPEPFLSGSERSAALWRKSHLGIILRQDLIHLEAIKDLVSIELMVQILKKRVGQQINYKNIGDELQVSPHTVKKWIQILESLFVVFVVYPYVKNVAEAVKKSPKVYFYDVGQVEAEEGFKLENVVALHFLNRNQFLEDTQGRKIRLCYIRDKKKREVDFAIEDNNKLTHLIEVKMSEEGFNVSLNYFSKKLNPVHSYQLVLNLKDDKDYENYKHRSLAPYLYNLEN